MRKSTALVAFVLFAIISQASAKELLAVFDFQADGVDEAKARKISELIRTDIITSGKYSVVEKKAMDVIIKEQSSQVDLFHDEGSAVKIGKLLSAKKILIGTVMKLGGTTIINGRIVDIETGIAEFGAKAKAESEDNLFDSITEFCDSITESKAETDNAKPDTTSVANTATGSDKPSMKTGKTKYLPDEPIEVTFANFPGTKYDWISVAKASSKPDQFDTYSYTNSEKNGVISFAGLAAGDYEVRAYIEYYKGNKMPVITYPFKVGSDAAKSDSTGQAYVKTIKKTYSSDESIIVQFGNFKGTKNEWISIAQKNEPKEKFQVFQYTKSRSSGELTFDSLPQGEYEVRAYLRYDVGSYDIGARYSFVVK
jgi:TolB-like protein